LHIPDGFLSPQVWAPLSVASAGAVAYAARRAERELPLERVPLVGATAAFLFAAQMVNFRVAAGTSGHLLGGVLAAALLGPHAGFIAMTVVLIVQALLFQDGGVTTLGANLLNMGVIGCYVGWGAFTLLSKAARGRGALGLLGFSAWLSVVVASAACAVELALSGFVPLRPALAAMVGVHALIGLGEGALTVAAVSLLVRWRADLVAPGLVPASGEGL
jgi:cobalt/nickel transport system permease protein